MAIGVIVGVVSRPVGTEIRSRLLFRSVRTGVAVTRVFRARARVLTIFLVTCC